jgi:hypothetical protein
MDKSYALHRSLQVHHTKTSQSSLIVAWQRSLTPEVLLALVAPTAHGLGYELRNARNCEIKLALKMSNYRPSVHLDMKSFKTHDQAFLPNEPLR